MRTVVACLLSLGAATWEHSKRTRWIGRSVLAANRVCVLAQKSAPEDEKVWACVVHFEHSSANLTARIGRLLGDPAALARCRRQTYHVFRHRFDVAAIFRRAQVPDLLRSLGWRLPPRSGEGRAQGRVVK